MKKKFFKILALDGGGVRGIFTAKVLELMQEKLGIDIYKSFDLVVGTSTGSIVAGAVVTNYCISQLVKDYRDVAPNIFHKRFLSCGYFRSKYKIGALESFLKEKYNDVTMDQIEKPLIINATNITSGEVYVIKSKYQEKYRPFEYKRDGRTPLFQAILASCAAPVYFDPVCIGDTLLCDGGIWANNPAVVGYTDAIKTFKHPKEAIKILSIGTDNTAVTYSKPTWLGWGLVTGWKRGKLVDFFMSCQTQVPTNILNLVLEGSFVRIEPLSSSNSANIKLEDYKSIPILEKGAEQTFECKASIISEFIGDSN